MKIHMTKTLVSWSSVKKSNEQVVRNPSGTIRSEEYVRARTRVSSTIEFYLHKLEELENIVYAMGAQFGQRGFIQHVVNT